MALRVLLADESSTIKKVFQLALQDFAVDVRPVNVGVDVLTVAQNFKPDIVFADVLLQKRNGYEVAAELKQDEALSDIPIVLMWSGFMELDEDKFQASHANAKLEKPFDVAALRKLVTDLVPRTQGQRLSEFLTFPKMPDMVEPPRPAAEPAMTAKTAPDEDFAQVPIPKMKTPAATQNFRVNLTPEEMDSNHVPVDFKVPPDALQVDELLAGPEEAEEEYVFRETKKKDTPPPPKGATQVRQFPPPLAQAEPEVEVDEDPLEDMPPIPAGARPAAPAQAMPTGTLSEAQLEKIIREQSAEVIEAVVWKVIPDLAAQIIERELNKLLKEREQNPY